MPTVPRVTGPQVQQGRTNITQSNLQAPEQRLETQSVENIGRAAEGLIQSAIQVEDEARRQGNQLAVLEADQKLSEIETRMLYDKDTGAMNRKGKDSFGLPDEILPEYQSQADSIMESLANDDQRAAFRKSVMSRKKDINNQLYRHMSREGMEFDDQLTKAYVANEYNAALKNFHDPDRVDMAVERNRAAVTQWADRNGVPADLKKQRIQEQESQIYSGVIGKIVDGGDDLAAKEYFKKYKDKLTAADEQKISKLLEEGSLRGESQRRSDEMWQKSGEDLGQAMAKAEKINDPKLRDETMRRLRQKQNDKQAAITASQNQNFMDASEFVKGNPAVDPQDSMPVSVWNSLTLQQQQSLRKINSNPKNNDKIWLDFFDKSPQQLANMPRAEFEQKYWVHLDSSHRTRAEKMWKDASEGVDSPDTTNALTFKNRVDNTLRQSGFVDLTKSRRKLNDKEAKIYTQFEQEAAERLEDFERNELAGKRKATGQEVQKVLDDMITKKVFVDKNWLWSDPVKPAALITNDEKGDAYIPIKQVPQKDRNAIENLIKSRGARVTNEKVEKAYAAMLIDDRALFDTIIGD